MQCCNFEQLPIFDVRDKEYFGQKKKGAFESDSADSWGWMFMAEKLEIPE